MTDVSSGRRQAAAILRQHGTSYNLAAKLFPKKLREATAVLYAFVRLPDEIVDNPVAGADPEQELMAWVAAWRLALAKNHSDNPVMNEIVRLFQDTPIPQEEGEEFLRAMQEDLTVSRYLNYRDLVHYMDGSAAVVGVMMTRIIGVLPTVNVKQVFAAARKLGYAMQLTNFLRDVAEDYRLRDRIYLPQEDMHKFKVSDADIAAGTMTESLRALIAFEAARARKLYAEALAAVHYLNPEGRLAIRLAANLYKGILDVLEARDYNVFAGRARTSFFQKIYIGFTTWQSTRKLQS